MGDVSYLSPDSFKYSLPLYWRMTCHGTDGVIETWTKYLMLYKNGETEGRKIGPDPGIPNGYLESFLKEIQGLTEGLTLTTTEVLASSRATLLTQDAADKRKFGITLKA